MNNEIFRKKSLDSIKSPDNLDEYIRVSNPGVWLLLASVLALLIGFCVWGFFGHIESTVPATVTVHEGEAVCQIARENIVSVRTGQTVRFGGTKTTIAVIGDENEHPVTCTLSDSSPLPDGSYTAAIVIESYRPMSFILN